MNKRRGKVRREEEETGGRRKRKEKKEEEEENRKEGEGEIEQQGARKMKEGRKKWRRKK